MSVANFAEAPWPCRRLKFCATYNDETLSDNTDDFKLIEYVEISDVSIVEGIRSSTPMLFHEAPSRARRKVRAGDVLVSTVRTYLKAIVALTEAPENLIASTGFCVIRPTEDLHAGYAGWVAKSEEFVGEVVSRSVGVSYPAINASELLDIKVPLPPLEIQKRIAAFLDEKTARIDALIAKKRALLERLAEKRQAIITQAVTKGLNPAAPMKDSGIHWLGAIPAHWQVKRLKYVSPRVTVGIVVTPAAYYTDEGVLALRGLNVRTMGFDLSDTRNITRDGHELNRKSELREDDLVAVRTGAPGTTAIVTGELAGCNCVDLVIIRKPAEAAPRYLGWFLNSDVAKTQYSLGSEGALQQHFNVETSKEVSLTLPPLKEQHEIAAYIDTALAAHDRQSGMVETSVSRLQEYRAAIITAAVTGRIEGLQ
ncbi:MAG: restriction endonuclease subunit S [Alphaproteobacteria bacterium]|nr:restriction endonuclease subunit S [Alphaproteobacteria bacterium]